MNTLPSYSTKRLIYSAMASVQFFKGFSSIRTGSPKETAEWIIWTADKIERNIQKNKIYTQFDKKINKLFLRYDFYTKFRTLL